MSPIREFECQHCGEELERYEPYIEKRQASPRCSCGKKMKKMFSAPHLVMYGEGCYESSRHGSQWRNGLAGKDSKNFRRRNEGKSAQDAPDSHVNKLKITGGPDNG